MFFKKSLKNQEDRLERLEERLRDQFQSLEKVIGEGTRKSEETAQALVQLQSAARKSDMAIEDLLEEWSERQADEQEIRERFREYEQKERRLLELFEAYQEQFFRLKRFACGKDETWSEQMALMEKNLERSRQSCGIGVIDGCGVEVDYDLHEVIETIETEDPDSDGRIAEIYRCGYRYGGKVKQKAQVAAYRMIVRRL